MRQGERLQDTNLCTVHVSLPASGTMRKEMLGFKSPSLCCSVCQSEQRENSELRHLQAVCSQEFVAFLSLVGLQKQYG